MAAGVMLDPKAIHGLVVEVCESVIKIGHVPLQLRVEIEALTPCQQALALNAANDTKRLLGECRATHCDLVKFTVTDGKLVELNVVKPGKRTETPSLTEEWEIATDVLVPSEAATTKPEADWQFVAGAVFGPLAIIGIFLLAAVWQ